MRVVINLYNILIMSLTSYDGFFGWVHGLKISRTNHFFGGRFGINETPYPVIVNRPSFYQVANNWNFADTGMVISFFLLGLAIARRRAVKDLTSADSLIERRTDFKRYHRVVTAFGIFLALRNSAYRLEGHVPNGLPRKDEEAVVKYDYSTDLINSTFWRFFVEPQAKPSA